VNLAARGLRQIGEEAERIEDEEELARVRSQARIVHTKALVTAVLITFLTLLLP
jgi:hypothetical protein